MAPDSARVQRWAAAQAATVTRPAANAPQEPTNTPVREFPREPVPAVLAALTEVRTLDGVAEHINPVAWGRELDGRLLLATGAMGGIARIWDTDTGQQLHTLTGHTDTIGRAEWGRTRDGRLLLATGSYDGTARIWDPDTGRCLHTLICHNRASNVHGGVAVAWGTSTSRFPVLATGDAYGIIRIWDPDSGRKLSTFPSGESHLASGRARIYSMAWATGADGQARLAAHSLHEGMLRIWDPVTEQVLYTSPADQAGSMYSIAYGYRADGQLVLASAKRAGVHVWTEDNGEFISQSLPAANDAAHAVRWAPLTDGRLLLATSNDHALDLWDGHALHRLHTEELDFTQTGPGRVDWTLTPDGHLLLATACNGGKVRIWEAVLDPPVRPPGDEVWRFPVSGRVVHRQPAPAQLVLPPREVTPPFSGPPELQETKSLACITVPDGRTLLATAHTNQHTVQLWELESGRHLRTLTGHSRGTTDVAWGIQPNGTLLLATASYDKTARIWDPDTGRELHVLTGHTNSVFAVAWGTQPDGTLLLATASSDQTARIWDPDTGYEIHTLTGHSSSVYAVAWGTQLDGTPLLATGAYDDTARIWDPGTGRELHVLTGHEGGVDTVAWTTLPDGTMVLATGGRDGTMRSWDPETGQQLQLLTRSGREDDRDQGNDEIYVATWTQAADERLLLTTAGRDGTARIWDPDTGAKLASLPGTGSLLRSAAWTRDREGNLLLLLASPDGAPGPVRAWLVETGHGGQTEPQPPGRPGPRQAIQASRQLLRLGASELWLPLGLLTDLVTLTGTEDTPPAADLHDTRLAALASEPGIRRLGGLATGQPRWSPDARVAFAALFAAGLDIPDLYTPPPDAQPAELRGALGEALTTRTGDPTPTRPWRVAITSMQTAVSAVDDRMIALLAILGPDACAADPLLPLRLAHHAPLLPALSPRELRFLASVGSHQPPSPGAAAAGTLTYSPGTVGVARTGSLNRLLPTQLALPADLLTARLAEDQLLYRQHRAPAPPVPEPVTLILDTTPPTYGPAGAVLRLAAHLITTTLWAHGHHPALITLDSPATPRQLHAPADLIPIWTATTLDNPAALLTTARHTAITLSQPTLLLTHHNTARDSGYTPGPATRLLTTHQPPEKPRPRPTSPWHIHLPPDPTQAQLATAIARLLTPSAENGR